MTVDRRSRTTALGLAKALHPAGRTRARQGQPEDPSRRPRPSAQRTDAGAAMPAVLWEEEACRARLLSAEQGWLSCPGGRGGHLVSIVAVEGDDVLFVARPTSGLRDISGGTATLEVVGVTTEGRRWVIRASGVLQWVLLEEPPRRSGGPAAPPGQELLGSGDLAVLGLTVQGIRGFERSGRLPGR